MAGLLDDLVSILEGQLENYTDLLDLSDEKRQVIINNDVESLQKITVLENTLVSRNQKLEKKREAVISDMALVLNRKKESLTISEIAGIIKNRQEHDKLLEIATKIRSVLNELKHKNDINRTLIENSLEYIDYCMNVIHDRVTNQRPYPVVDEPGFIDARQ